MLPWRWNAHPRDAAGLVAWVEKAEGHPLRWQTATLGEPLEDLRESALVYITAETPPKFSDEEKKTLRAYTDTGGTVLLEASCGNPAVKGWFAAFVKEVWPQGELKALEADHPVYAKPYTIKQKMSVQGISDGKRTIVYFCPDDVSCTWQGKPAALKDYVFKWGTNLAVQAQVDQLRTQLAASPKDKEAAERLVRLLVMQLDTPGEALKYASLLSDDNTKRCLAVADMATENLPEAACLALAEWYAGLADSVTGDPKIAMLRRAKASAAQFLKLHPATDPDRTKATKILGKATVAGVK